MSWPPGAGEGTRRGLLQRSAAAGAAVALGACGSSRQHAAGHEVTSPDPDARLLNISLALKYEAVAAYAAGIPLLGRRPREGAKRFLDQEISQTGELAGLVKQAGGKPNKPQPTYDLGHPSGQRAVLMLLEGLERRQVHLFLAAVPQLSTGARRAAAGAVLGSDAQHLVLLRGFLGQEPLTTPILASGN